MMSWSWFWLLGGVIAGTLTTVFVFLVVAYFSDRADRARQDRGLPSKEPKW